jgi:glucose/arabinose dehydrogenase
MRSPLFARAGAVAALCGAATPASAQNRPPAAPAITEPVVGRIVNPADAHMETGPFSDPDAGDAHRCTDWEIWTAPPAASERIWVTSCIAGVERLHTHLADGAFQGSYAGRRELLASSAYRLRARHRDSSNDPATEWSPWSERAFSTGPASQVFPMDVRDVVPSPAPRWRDSGGATVTLPGGASPGVVRIESAAGDTLLELRGVSAGPTQVINPPPLPEHIDARVRFAAGSAALDLPESSIAFTSEDGVLRTVYLPRLQLDAGLQTYLWVSANGSTFLGSASQTEPDFSSLVRGAPVPWTVAQPGFRVEVVATGFQLPVNIAFVPVPGPGPTDPFYYVTELYGTIKVVLRNGTVQNYATGLINFNPTGAFPGSGEQGLTGLAIEPATGDVFAAMLYDSAPPNGAHYPKVVRFHSIDGGRTANTQTIVRAFPGETQGQSHQISNLSIGPDGKLYVHMGDGFDASRGQNLSSFRGKVLRMNLDGTAASDNPFYNASDGISARDYVFAYGLRNPFGGAWRAADGAHYEVENGPTIDRFAKIVRGRNYLYDGSDSSMRSSALYNWNPSTGPVNIAFVEPFAFGGSGFPADRMDHAFVTESGATWASGPQTLGKKISEWVLDASGNLVGAPRTLILYNGAGKATAAGLAAGPDGLYFSDLYKDTGNPQAIDRGANILRVRWIGLTDCNANGVPDDQDVSAGTSGDCNGNGIPDECDIAAGRSQDCNLTGTPDECDTLAFTATDFSSTAGFRLNGSASVVSGAARLTPATNSQAGSVVFNSPNTRPLTRFSASFDFRMGGGSGADGMSFALLDSARFTTDALFGETGPAGAGTLAVEFDTYPNAGENGNHLDLYVDGLSLGTYDPTFTLNDGNWHGAYIFLEDGLLTVRIRSATGWETAYNRVPVPAYEPLVALYGFGARTGGSTDEHWVDNVSFGVGGHDDANDNRVPDSCECPTDFNRNGAVAVDDFLAFLAAFSAGDPRCDFTADGSVSVADFLAFLNLYSAGCP